MLNIFPELLDYGFIAPTLLRLLLGVYFIKLGVEKYNVHKDHIAEFLSSLKLNPAVTIVQTLGGVEIVLGLMFITGTLTQIAALITLIIALVSLVLTYKAPELKIKTPTIYLFIITISLSLLLSGAGFLAVDFPL